jgi:PD-(D/E)XK nuclease superfamily
MQIRGGNAGIFKNGEFRTDTSTGCPRVIKLRAHGFQSGIVEGSTAKVFKVGHLFEDWFAKENPGLKIEHPVTFQITEDVQFAGHIDFVGEEFIYELKSVTSKNTYRDVFKKKKPKDQNLIQLITYMVALERDKGKLIYGSFVNTITYDMFEEIGDDEFEEMCETLTPDDTIEFFITITKDGDVLCDGKSTDISVTDICEFWNQAAAMVVDEEVPAKPGKINEKNYFGPCHFCDMKNICASDYDSWDQFYHTVKNFIAQK